MNDESKRFLDGRNTSPNKHVLSERLPKLCECAPEAALHELETARAGLTEEQVAARQAQYGLNEVSHEKPPTWYQQLFRAFLTPFNGVLFAVSIVSLFSDVIFAAPDDRSFRTIIVLTAMVLLSTLLRFWQEFRSNRAAEELKAMVSSTTAVLRAGDQRPREIPISDLVPGDIVYLSAGDMVPADVRLLTAKDLFVSQAMLTGESVPLEKYPVCRRWPSPVVSAALWSSKQPASWVPTWSAARRRRSSRLPAMPPTSARWQRASSARAPLTSFDSGINRVSWLLIRFMLVMTPLVFLINGVTKARLAGSVPVRRLQSPSA